MFILLLYINVIAGKACRVMMKITTSCVEHMANYEISCAACSLVPVSGCCGYISYMDCHSFCQLDATHHQPCIGM